MQLLQSTPRLMAAVEGKGDAKGFARAAADASLMGHCSGLLSTWCNTVEEVLLGGLESTKDASDAGGAPCRCSTASATTLPPDGLCALRCAPL